MNRRIIPLIMCGGAGTRLWPASREVHPKQFLPLFGARSTFQDTLLRVSDATLFERPVVITNNAYRFMVLEQLAEIGIEADVLLEPMRRDSGPAIAAGAVPREPPFADIAAAIRRHSLPIAPLHDLVAAFRQDVTTTRYATQADLDDYCAHSANPVGRTLLALYGAGSPANVAASDAICTALQLTNFWQDVAVDWQKGRVYIPREHLDRFGIDESAIAEGRADARWQALMRFLCDDTRQRFSRGRALPRALPWRQGLELAAVIAGGRRILARIDGVGGDVFRRRPTLSTMDWLRVSARALVPAG